MTGRPPKAFTRRQALRLLGAGAGSVGASCLLGSCSTLDFLAGSTREVTDDTGREVVLPATRLLKSVYFTSPLAQTFCFTMAPDLLAATSMIFTDEQLKYLPEGTGELVYLGSLSAGGQLDVPSLQREGVQVVLSISGIDLTDVNIEDALALERESGIPVFLIDGSYDVIGNTYRTLGVCLGRQERAEELAVYCEQVYDRVKSALAGLPDNERVRYYYAEGPEGLLTEPDASQHSLIFRESGGVNVAATVEGVATSSGVAVTLDQVKTWDPDVIISWSQRNDKGADSYIRESTAWSSLAAVKNDRVYTMPSIPFPFCDRPPGINRFLGLQWLANTFYPERFDVDMVDIVREFYSKCYWRDITPEQARYILNAGRQ